jgi:hypothetical protein
MRTKYTDVTPKEKRMKTHLGLAVALGAALMTSAAWAQDAPAHHYHHHYHHHHHSLTQPTPAPAEGPGAAVETAPPAPLTSEMFKPYAHPGEGDDDGLSRDPDDCMKGCIGGNPQ